MLSKSCPALVNPWTVACQAPLSTEFSRQEYWSGLPFPSPGELPDPGTELKSPALPADALLTKLQGKLQSKSCLVVSNSLWPHGLWNIPGQKTGVGSLSLLQGIFPTQELNPGIPHCRQILYQPSHEGSPKMWRCRGLNPGPHTCKACALPLSYIPFPQILCSWNEDVENRIFSSFPKHCVRSGHSEFSPWVPLPIQIGPHPGEPTSQGRPALSGWRS